MNLILHKLNSSRDSTIPPALTDQRKQSLQTSSFPLNNLIKPLKNLPKKRSSAVSTNQSMTKPIIKKLNNDQSANLFKKVNEIDLDLRKQQHQQIIIDILSKQRNKTYNETSILHSIIQNLSFFRDHKELLSISTTSRELMQSLKIEYVLKHETLFSIGDTGSAFYIIIQGSVYCLLENKNFQDQQQSLPSSIALSKDGKNKQTQGNPNNSNNSCSHFEELKKIQIQQELQPQQQLLQQDNFQLEQEKIELQKMYPHLNLVNILHPGQSFGEISLITQQPRQATIIMRQNTYLMTLSKEAFNKILGKYEQFILRDRFNFLSKYNCFQYHTLTQMLLLLHFFKIRHFTKNDILYSEGDASNKVYFIKQGEVSINKRCDLDHYLEQSESAELSNWKHSRNTSIYKLNKMQQLKNQSKAMHTIQLVLIGPQSTFGDEEILEDQTQRMSTAIVTSSSAEIFEIQREKFLAELNSYNTKLVYMQELEIKLKIQSQLFQNNLQSTLAQRKKEIIEFILSSNNSNNKNNNNKNNNINNNSNNNNINNISINISNNNSNNNRNNNYNNSNNVQSHNENNEIIKDQVIENINNNTNKQQQSSSSSQIQQNQERRYAQSEHCEDMNENINLIEPKNEQYYYGKRHYGIIDYLPNINQFENKTDLNSTSITQALNSPSNLYFPNQRNSNHKKNNKNNSNISLKKLKKKSRNHSPQDNEFSSKMHEISSSTKSTHNNYNNNNSSHYKNGNSKSLNKDHYYFINSTQLNHNNSKNVSHNLKDSNNSDPQFNQKEYFYQKNQKVSSLSPNTTHSNNCRIAYSNTKLSSSNSFLSENGSHLNLRNLKQMIQNKQIETYEKQKNLIEMNSNSLDIQDISPSLLQVYQHHHFPDIIDSNLKSISQQRINSMNNTFRQLTYHKNNSNSLEELSQQINHQNDISHQATQIPRKMTTTEQYLDFKQLVQQTKESPNSLSDRQSNQTENNFEYFREGQYDSQSNSSHFFFLTPRFSKYKLNNSSLQTHSTPKRTSIEPHFSQFQDYFKTNFPSLSQQSPSVLSSRLNQVNSTELSPRSISKYYLTKDNSTDICNKEEEEKYCEIEKEVGKIQEEQQQKREQNLKQQIRSNEFRQNIELRKYITSCHESHNYLEPTKIQTNQQDEHSLSNVQNDKEKINLSKFNTKQMKGKYELFKKILSPPIPILLGTNKEQHISFDNHSYSTDQQITATPNYGNKIQSLKESKGEKLHYKKINNWKKQQEALFKNTSFTQRDPKSSKQGNQTDFLISNSDKSKEQIKG